MSNHQSLSGWPETAAVCWSLTQFWNNFACDVCTVEWGKTFFFKKKTKSGCRWSKMKIWSIIIFKQHFIRLQFCKKKKKNVNWISAQYCYLPSKMITSRLRKFTELPKRCFVVQYVNDCLVTIKLLLWWQHSATFHMNTVAPTGTQALFSVAPPPREGIMGGWGWRGEWLVEGSRTAALSGPP